MSSNKEREKIILSALEHLRLHIDEFTKKFIEARTELAGLRHSCRIDNRDYEEKRNEVRNLSSWLKECNFF